MADEQITAQAYMYHIRVQGNLDAKWAEWFPGFVMHARPGGQTLLSGAGVDQAALHGVLDRIHRLGLPLLLVVQTVCPCPEWDCPRHGQCGVCASFRNTVGDQFPYCFQSANEWDQQCKKLMTAG